MYIYRGILIFNILLADKPGSKQSEQERDVDDMVASARQLSIRDQKCN